MKKILQLIFAIVFFSSVGYVQKTEKVTVEEYANYLRKLKVFRLNNRLC